MINKIINKIEKSKSSFIFVIVLILVVVVAPPLLVSLHFGLPYYAWEVISGAWAMFLWSLFLLHLHYGK